MELLVILVFLGLAILSFALLAISESKREKRMWEWRERLLESINHNTESIEEVVKAIMYEK